MFNYKTIEETAADWGVSISYVQGLCRHEKISGALKKAGVWFIPDTAARPPKTNGHYLRFKGTKELIFKKSVELFSQKTFESVTMKDIADEVGIRQSAVYNHFKSKQDILDTIYNFSDHYFIADRPTIEELEPILLHGSLMDIITCVNYSFKGEYEDLLILCTKLVFQRAFVDARAKELFYSKILNTGVEFVKDVFDRAVELKRLAPFDTYTMSVLCNMNRWYFFLNWLANSQPENVSLLLEDQLKINEYAIRNLTDLHEKDSDEETRLRSEKEGLL